MATLELEVLGLASLGLAFVLLSFGAFLLVFLRRRGGLELALANMMAVPRYRTVFLGGLVLALTALFVLGLAQGLEQLEAIPDAESAVVQLALFAAGSAGILILMVNSLHTREPTLQMGWALRESAERMTIAATPGWPSAFGTDGSDGPESDRTTRKSK